jgi:hypothetical protein
VKRLGAVVAACLTLVALVLTSGRHPTPYYNFALLADAFVHGRVWIDWPGPYIDALPYAGKYYIIEAPMPAILLVPFVRFFGPNVDQTLLSQALGAVATYAGWEIARTLGVPLRTRALLCAFLLLGTDLFWCAMFGDVWFIAHVSSVAFTLLALLELLRGRRGWLAFGAGTTPQCRRRVASFVLVLVPFVALWVWYNELRWGLPYDIGYTAWYHQDGAGMPTGSPFRLAYLPYQLDSFFVQHPDFVPAFPYVIPSISGIALTWTSPGLVLAFFARRPMGLVVALWALTLLTAAPNFVYYVNGFAQFGMRHALDFEPFLFVLMALALRRGANPIATILMLYSILVGSWGVWYWRVYVRQ